MLRYFPIFILLSVETFALNKQLQDYLDQVFQQSPDLKKSEEEFKKTSAEKLQYKSGFLPDLEASYTYFKDDQPSKGVENPQETTKLTLRQNVFNGFRDYNLVRASSSNEKVFEAAVLSKKMELAERALEKFFQYYGLTKEIEHLKQQVSILDGRTKEQNQRSKIGKSRAAEFYSSSAELKLKESELQELSFKLKTYETTLKETAGALPPPFTFNEEIKVGPIETFKEKLNNRPDLKAEHLKKEMRISEVNQIESEFLPNINLLGNYYFDRPVSKDDSDWDVTLTVTLPLFSGLESYSKRNAKKQEVIMGDYSEKIRSEQLVLELEERYNTLIQYQNNVNLLKESLDLSKKSYELTRQDYNYGRVNNLEVLQSLRTYIDTARAFDRNTTNLFSAYNKLIVFVGDL